jgi:hypothetical protein
VAPLRVRERPLQVKGIVHGFGAFGKEYERNALEEHVMKLHGDQARGKQEQTRTHSRCGAVASASASA